ncbi:MAG: dihydrodipicolinate synthase family protein [Micrococcus sp.]|nr:dihydrodipicolinate synthase family protein [Micrococcus sp.]
MNTALTGVVPPVLTPLDAAGNLDLRSLEALVTRLLEAGVDGLFALGSSSETVFMDPARRLQILDAILDMVAGQVPVLAGVIDTQVGAMRPLLEEVSRRPVAGVVATAPFYAITGPVEVDEHFRQVAALSAVPVWAYDIPVCTHYKISPEALMALAEDRVIVGVKDSSGDDVSFRRLARFNAASGSGLSLLTGHEVVVDGAYLAGGHGAVPGLANVDPGGYVRMHRAALAGDWETVRREQDRLAGIFEIVFSVRDRVGPAQGIGAFKTALQQLGVFATNAMHPPLTPLTEQHRPAIRELLEAYDVR